MPNAYGQALQVLGFCALIGTAVSAAAQEPPALSAGDPVSPLEKWRNQAAETRRLLEAGSYQQALALVEPLIREMKNSTWIRPGSAPSLGEGVFLRAVAHAGLGHREDAAWDWFTAKSLDPTIAESNLASFGTAGQLLEEIRKPPREPMSIKKLESYAPRKVQPPRKIAGDPPSYPLSRKIACEDGVVLLEAILDEQGVPHDPAILRSPHPAFSLATLEAVRGWRFTPARFNGEIVKVYYTLTVRFKVENCLRPTS
jgi:TonB family protein